MKRLALFAIFAILAAAGLPRGLALARTVSSAPKVSVNEVAEGLTCQCGCGLTVANCNMPTCSFSVPVREQIEKMINAGLSRHQILGLFRAKYGEKILSAPEAHGFNALAWVMPFAMLFIGAAGILIALARWRGKQLRPASAPEEEETVQHYDRRLRYRLKREIERLG